MTNIQMWALVVGFLSPLVISIIQQTGWTNSLRASVTFIYCVLIGFVTVYLNGDVNVQNWVTTSLIILVTAIASYKGLWKDVGVTNKIETLTSRSKQ